MADFSALIASIRAQIRENGRQLITGPVMQASLLEIIDAVNAAKQDTIADLDAIRAGALLGSTAYQKPVDGIPFEDLTHSVQVSLESADQALKPNPAYDGQIPVYNEDGDIMGSGITPADVAAKADQDGTYPGLTAGAVLADAIPAEYLYRPCPAPMDGKAVLDAIKGKSLVWNQLAETNGPLSLTASSSMSYFGAVGALTKNIVIPEGHKYYLALNIARTIANNNGISFGLSASVTPAAIANGVSNGRVSVIATANSQLSSSSIYYNNYSGKRGLDAGDSIELSNIAIVDLTLMFGAGYEPSTVEEFQAMYPAPYYAYNAGQLINNAAEGIKTVGRNQINVADAEFGTYNQTTGDLVANTSVVRCWFPLIPGASYYINIPTGLRQDSNGVGFYRSDKSYTGQHGVYTNTNFVAPSDARFGLLVLRAVSGTITLDMVKSSLLCINLSDAAFNGQYEPYKESEVSLGLNSFQVTDGTNTITVNGLKSAGSVYDEIKDGKYIKRVDTRAHQSGDESDATVITDGTNTNAPLATPVEYDLVSEIPNSYPVYEGGTEEILSDAIVAPFCASIRYPASPNGLTIVDLLTALKAAGVISDFAVTVDAGTSKKAITITT